MIAAAAYFVALATVGFAQNTPCPVDPTSKRFLGGPVEQARCLLRPNAIGGVLGAELAKLPEPMEDLVGRPVRTGRASVRKFLAKHGVQETSIGGSLDDPLARALLPDGTTSEADYFIIHDTSSPYLRDEPFPAGFDSDKNWKGNDLSIWTNQPVAHTFVNRLGDSITTTPFSEPVRKGFGTKFARDLLKQDGKGLQIHIELVQPRRRDPQNANPNNDRFAPVPGFSREQYERLALLYVCASVRRGKWLIPAFHSAVDAGIKDAHDDPQNFVLADFAGALSRTLKKIK